MIRISIDIAAYRRNLSVLQRRLSPAELMAVVKDDAYGHGLESIVAAARDSGVSRFAVLDIPTGVLVRKIVPDSHVQLFAWLCTSKLILVYIATALLWSLGPNWLSGPCTGRS